MIFSRIGFARAALVFAVAVLPVCQGSAATLYSTGFENPPFTIGNIAGQDGWQVLSDQGAAQIENSFALSGSQAVELIPALASSQTGPYHVDSTAAGSVELSADIYLASSSSQSEWQFAALSSTLSPFLGGIDIFPNGNVDLITAGFTTVATWNYNAWNHVDLLFNIPAQTYSFSLNGLQLAADVPDCGDNSTCTGGMTANYGTGSFTVFASPSNNDIGYMDNYSVVANPVPEPMSVTLFLLGGLPVALCALSRRKKLIA